MPTWDGRPDGSTLRHGVLVAATTASGSRGGSRAEHRKNQSPADIAGRVSSCQCLDPGTVCTNYVGIWPASPSDLPRLPSHGPDGEYLFEGLRQIRLVQPALHFNHRDDSLARADTAGISSEHRRVVTIEQHDVHLAAHTRSIADPARPQLYPGRKKLPKARNNGVFDGAPSQDRSAMELPDRTDLFMEHHADTVDVVGREAASKGFRRHLR